MDPGQEALAPAASSAKSPVVIQSLTLHSATLVLRSASLVEIQTHDLRVSRRCSAWA